MKLRPFIAGKRVEPVGGVYEQFTGPLSDDPLAQVAVCDRADIASAAQAALAAFNAERPAASERARWLTESARLIRKEEKQLVDTIVEEMGKTVAGARAEVASAATALEVLAGEAIRMTGQSVPSDVWPATRGMLIYTRYEPAGPVCAITAFNAPVNQAAHKVGAAVAAGCPVVLKPSALAPIATSQLVDIFHAAGMAEGWINLIYGAAEVGQTLFGTEEFARFTFTGHRRVGDMLCRSIGIRRAVLEMGSNAPNIIHHDADQERAIDSIIDGGFATAGQVCIRPQRLFIHADIFNEFTAELGRRMRELKVGDPRLESTDMGPVRTTQAAERIVNGVRAAVERGATVLVGGTHEGRYVAPTLVTGVPADDELSCEEIFGPVIVADSYTDLGDAIERANASVYGLQAGVFSRNARVCQTVVDKIKVGGVIVNASSRLRTPQAPFGGVKQSGLGREGGRYGIEEFTELKTVFVST